MSYIDGYLVPVPTDKKNAYKAMAGIAAPIFREYGVVRSVLGLPHAPPSPAQAA